MTWCESGSHQQLQSVDILCAVVCSDSGVPLMCKVRPPHEDIQEIFAWPAFSNVAVVYVERQLL
ncbi:hypothetical protein C0Q70_01209 [Pomacea canaliculata]|uniref:Uncharacterized protein n=1 Tax=Pomacea canaliculata TaxID=400727 RepID=A0A2T7PYT8_POMCA|nr:hypothetical protein C0Q70_01209 [Pomacea canaliculata]